MKFLFIIFFTKSLFALTSVSIEKVNSKSEQLYFPTCKDQFSFKFLGLKQIPENYSEIINHVSVQQNDIADYSKIFTHPVVKCGYKFETIIGRDPVEMTIYAKKCFQHSGDKAIFVEQLDKDKINKTTIDTNGKKRRDVYVINYQYYIWESGICAPESKTFYDKVENKVKMRNLKKNRFLEVTVSNDEGIQCNSDFKMFYANPGLLIKTKKCTQSDKCKKDEVVVVYKKRLSDAILRKGNVVLTTDDF